MVDECNTILMSLYRLIFQMNGNVFQIKEMVILFVESIKCSQVMKIILSMRFWIVFWHKQVPLKVSMYVWRLLHNKLPTKDNLVRRVIISQENHYCVSGGGQVDTVSTCSFTANYSVLFGS
jgi:hypothetical protein